MSRGSLRADRRGAVALWIGLTIPTMLMALGLGIEVASWSVAQVELQRTADAAALAGSMNYTQTTSAQSAANAAANVAEINGISGTSSRSWDSGAKTLTDNMVTAAVVSGIKASSDFSMKVTVTRSIPLIFANVFSTLGSINVSASAWSELVVNSAATGPQPCFGALKPAGSGGTGISMSGTTTISDSSCSIRSNAGITLTGSGSLNTDGIYAGGSISIPFWVPVIGGEYPNDGTISDPYQSYSALQTALGQLSPGAGQALAVSGNNTVTIGGTALGSTTIPPGTYSSFTTGGYTNVTLSPGLYIINGPISLSGNTTISGSGVTIISSGSVTAANYVSLTLTAPGTSPTGSAVPGIAMAGTGSSVSFSGSGNFPFTGVVYFPNASLSASGYSAFGSSSCAELIAGSLTLSGSANFSGSCSSYGAPSYGSLPSTTSVSLVQ